MKSTQTHYIWYIYIYIYNDNDYGNDNFNNIIKSEINNSRDTIQWQTQFV